jgi:hypothetical protein
MNGALSTTNERLSLSSTAARPDSAEALAHASCMMEWLNRHLRSAPGACLWCDPMGPSDERLVPVRTATAGHAWLHRRCFADWHARRNAEATEALASIGIEDQEQQEMTKSRQVLRRKPNELTLSRTIRRTERAR